MAFRVGPWCYTEGEGRTCLHAGCPDGVPGTDIAELWCAIPGNDWFEIGPTCVGEIPAWAVVDAGWMPNCNEQKGAGVKIFTGGGTSVCIVDLSLDDPVESDAATGSVPRELLVLLLPGLLALGLL